MSDIIDLDVLVPADKKVTLKSKVYTLPGDMPMATYLKINKIATMQESGASQDDLLGETVDALVELFCWNIDPTRTGERVELAEIFRGLGVRTVMAIISKVYPSDDEDEAGEADVDAVVEDPTPPESGTTTPTTSQPESSPSAS